MIKYPTTKILLTSHVEFHLPSDTRAGDTPGLWIIGSKDRKQGDGDKDQEWKTGMDFEME